jgi:hypothetical protein
MRGLPGLPTMKPQPVEETAALLVRGMERRSRTIATPAARLAILVPDVFQLAVEGLARRHRWAAAIREQERANGGRDASPGTPSPVVIQAHQEDTRKQ